MPLFNKEDVDIKKIPGVGSLTYSATRMNVVEKIGTNYITLVTIAIDKSRSTEDFADSLKEMLKVIIKGCKKDQYAQNVFVRVILFSNDVHEVHGFVPLLTINEEEYEDIVVGGMTSLHDATYSCVGATLDYAKDLFKRDHEIISINYIVTDGGENYSVIQEASEIANAITRAKQSEYLESITNILVQLNDPNRPNPQVEKDLKKFKDDVGITKYINVGDATPEALADLGEFVVGSVSSASQSVQDGSPLEV